MEKFTILSQNSMRLQGQVAGHDNLSDEVVELLCEEVNYRIREIIQLSLDNMKQAKRKKLKVSDVNFALESLDVEQVHGYHTGSNAPRFSQLEDEDLFYEEDQVVDLFKLSTSQLQTFSFQPSTMTRTWLTVEGAPVSNGGLEPQKIPIHKLSEDEEFYFNFVTNHLFKSHEDVVQRVIKDVGTCAHLSRLVPHLLNFLAQQVEAVSNNTSQLFNLIDLIRALVTNPYVDLRLNPYMDLVMALVHHCQVGIPNETDDTNIWDVQEAASQLYSTIFQLWGERVGGLYKTHEEFLMNLISNTSHPLHSICGSTFGLLSLQIQSIERFLPFIYRLLHHFQDQSLSCRPHSITRFLEVSKLVFEKVLRHNFDSLVSSCEHASRSRENFSGISLYLISQEVFGDSLSIKLPCFPVITSRDSLGEIKCDLPGKEFFECEGDALSDILTNETSDEKKKEDVRIKSTLSDPLHGIKLKISKFPKLSGEATEANGEGFPCESKTKKAEKKNFVVSRGETFDEVPLRRCEDLVISFHFRNQNTLNTFTEKKKAEILARNMARQHASTSRYRDLCNNLQLFGKSMLLFKLHHSKSLKPFPYSCMSASTPFIL